MNGILRTVFRDMGDVGCRQPREVKGGCPPADLQSGRMLHGIVSDGIPMPPKPKSPDHYVGPVEAVTGTSRIIR